MDKTVAMLVVLLAAALEPRAEPRIWELKEPGIWTGWGRSRTDIGSGADEDTIAAALADLRDVAENELIRRAKVIRSLPKDRCPNSKVTPELRRRSACGCTR